MKIAVTSQGDNLTCLIDSRFGRAAFIILVDMETFKFEAIDNLRNKNAFKNAGIRAANMVCKKGAEVVITGFCGPNAFSILKVAGIKVADRINGRVLDVVQNLKNGQLVFSNRANIEKHW
ncbi:MAG: dinitrogenase iron-molybdenum cofactor biosynthesis protein [Desulfobacteraceae bacterium]|nr:dinitrogenase iron-molybdenum cofactor biosynthesis protein [Desulfobacteraceae bacterium]